MLKTFFAVLTANLATALILFVVLDAVTSVGQTEQALEELESRR